MDKYSTRQFRISRSQRECRNIYLEDRTGAIIYNPLVIGQTNFSGEIQRIIPRGKPDQQIAENVGEYLFGSDRTGAIIYTVSKARHEYNGTDYTSTGLSDAVTVVVVQ